MKIVAVETKTCIKLMVFDVVKIIESEMRAKRDLKDDDTVRIEEETDGIESWFIVTIVEKDIKP